MKMPWSKPETKNAQPLIALANLPNAAWGRADPAALIRDGYTGNAAPVSITYQRVTDTD